MPSVCPAPSFVHFTPRGVFTISLFGFHLDVWFLLPQPSSTLLDKANASDKGMPIQGRLTFKECIIGIGQSLQEFIHVYNMSTSCVVLVFLSKCFCQYVFV